MLTLGLVLPDLVQDEIMFSEVLLAEKILVVQSNVTKFKKAPAMGALLWVAVELFNENPEHQIEW